MAAPRDYYQVLGVGESAKTDEIKKAFRRLAKQHHPDRNPNNPQAADRFKEINEAHDVLSDPDKRKKYDQLRRYGAFAGPSGGSRRGPTSGGGAGGAGGDFDISDLGGLGDLFSSIFGRRGGAGAGREEAEELEVTVAIPFRVAGLGGKVPITLSMPEVCPTCGGKGGAPGATISTCAECKGRGTISFGQGGFAVNRPCPVCRGKGTVPSQRCGTCQGSGEVRVEKRITVDIPAGIEEGTRLRLKNQGPKGRGDVIAVIQVQPDRFFRREGLDVIGVVPINLAQAMLGSRIKVKTLDGKRVVLKIPTGTQHGQKFRVPGQGIERNGRRGDLYVEVHVTLPERLTPEEEAAVKDFAEKAGLKY
ncbi:MAG: DnaJ C-terminal domain-containing protein [Gemmatimonadales bacterium]|nr:DnaJ C-terminal domain-containing protein [Gemmatimonadales bacterium]